jgi:hypothetical protein
MKTLKVVFVLASFGVFLWFGMSNSRLAAPSFKAKTEALRRQSAPAQASESDDGMLDRKEAPQNAPLAIASPAPQPTMVANKMAMKDMVAGGGAIGSLEKRRMAPAKAEAPGEALAATDDVSESAPEAATRAWFPETFLFEPLIVTDALGRASVPVKIPDRLTTWRMLALAHSREGQQAGTVSSFVGTLPVYLDAVTPSKLFAGDEIRLPIQAVNTTDRSVKNSLALSASGGNLSSNGRFVEVAAFGSTVEYTTLKTVAPGLVTLKANFGSVDSLEKTISVVPAGHRETISRGGTLGAPRSLEIVGPLNPCPRVNRCDFRCFRARWVSCAQNSRRPPIAAAWLKMRICSSCWAMRLRSSKNWAGMPTMRRFEI